MNDLVELVAEANRLYEEEDYAAAHDLYKAAAMLAPPNEYIMTFLMLSLWYATSSFLMDLLTKYPDSIVVKQGVAVASLDRSPMRAAAICSSLLERGTLTLEDELNLRWIRLQAAVRTMRKSQPEWYNTIIEDFTRLWSFDGKWRSVIPYNRQLLLEALARICYPLCIPALQILVDQSGITSDVKEFLLAKINELRALNEITS
jgi:hypothetical protein